MAQSQILSLLSQGNSDLLFEKKVVERRAEMAAQCECLAAWVEGRECICNKTVELPLSADNLKKAHALVGEIEGCEKRLRLISEIKSDNVTCLVQLEGMKRINHGGGMVYYEDGAGSYHSYPNVALPKAILIAALNEERAKLLIELQKTGIVSVGKDNIRTVPK